MGFIVAVGGAGLGDDPVDRSRVICRNVDDTNTRVRCFECERADERCAGTTMLDEHELRVSRFLKRSHGREQQIRTRRFVILRQYQADAWSDFVSVESL